ncbi:MAG: GxxExxY protein [Acidobacteriota bacterium]|jgi:GxxExxY protein
MDLNEITREIIGAAIEVHRAMGPGLLESAYEACLACELRTRGLKVEQQRPVALVYHEIKLECGCRMDMKVEDQVIVEVKSVECVLPVHKAQLLSHVRLANLKVGLLINFNLELLKSGITRVVNNL